MSGVPGLTEKCRPTISVLSGRNQNANMGHVALGWYCKVDKFQEIAVLDEACKVLLGWPFCSVCQNYPKRKPPHEGSLSWPLT